MLYKNSNDVTQKNNTNREEKSTIKLQMCCGNTVYCTIMVCKNCNTYYIRLFDISAEYSCCMCHGTAFICFLKNGIYFLIFCNINVVKFCFNFSASFSIGKTSKGGKVSFIELISILSLTAKA